MAMLKKEAEKLELKKRLKQAFPERWRALTSEEKERVLNKYHELVWPSHVAARETLAGIANKGLTFGMVFIGAALALLLGLMVNIVDRFFMHWGYFYDAFVFVALVVLVWWINQIFEESIIQDYRDSNFLDELLK